MVTARQKEGNLLKYNVAGDCLAIKLEGAEGRRSEILDKIF